MFGTQRTVLLFIYLLRLQVVWPSLTIEKLEECGEGKSRAGLAEKEVQSNPVSRLDHCLWRRVFM